MKLQGHKQLPSKVQLGELRMISQLGGCGPLSSSGSCGWPSGSGSCRRTAESNAGRFNLEKTIKINLTHHDQVSIERKQRIVLAMQQTCDWPVVGIPHVSVYVPQVHQKSQILIYTKPLGQNRGNVNIRDVPMVSVSAYFSSIGIGEKK